ncbi:MAG: RDD family protein [Myxococcales bacterium]
MPACPKCGYPQATPLTCPKCGATFTKPLSIPEQSAAPVPSTALGKEIQIDCRSVPRAAPAAPAAPPAARSAAAPAAAAQEESWMMEPGESPHPKPAPKPAAKLPATPQRPPAATPAAAAPPPAAPKAAAPPAPAPFPAAKPPAPVAAPEPNKNAITGKFGRPEDLAAPAAPKPVAPAAVPAPAPAPVAVAVAPVAPPPMPKPEPVAAPAPQPERRDEMLSAGQMSAIAPEPEFEKSPLPRVDAPSEPPLSRMKLEPRDEAHAEPTAPSKPPHAAAGSEPVVLSGSTPPAARSMAVRSAEIPVEAIHAEPGGAFAQLGAGLVDAIVVGVLFVACLSVAQLIAGKMPASDETGLDWLIERTLTWRRVLVPGLGFLGALWFVYGSLFHALGGKTLGKRLFGLTVVDATGLPPRLSRSAARSLYSFASAALLMMGYVLVLFDAKKQALHDKLAHTFVVRLAD